MATGRAADRMTDVVAVVVLVAAWLYWRRQRPQHPIDLGTVDRFIHSRHDKGDA
jgi:hypothetical protein